MEKPETVEVDDAMATVAEELIKEDFKESWKDKLMRLAMALFYEKKEGKWAISVGRISWWLAFSPALYIWIDSKGIQDISEHHLTILIILAGYNFGKKVVDKFKKLTTTASPVDGPG